MGWTDVFPVFAEEMVDEFEELATPEERDQLEEWYGTERVLNPQPDCRDVVSVSLFWKNVRAGDPDLPPPTREILQNAQAMGLAKRFNPWDHYVKPLLELVPKLKTKFPDVAFRVYLAKDMEFIAEELAEAGNEVHVMKSSSIHFAPGGLWRFLPFGESGKRVTVTDVDRLNELESDLLRTRTMEEAGVGAWRVPVPIDLTGDRHVCYLPFMGCQFGVQGGLMNVRQLLDAFTWHSIRGNIDPNIIYPGCGPLLIQAHKWPSYGFDEFFMTVAAYPRLAQHGMLTFVPTFTKSQLLTLDIEYATWGNPNSELVYFPGASCCGMATEQPLEEASEELEPDPEDAIDTIIEFPMENSASLDEEEVDLGQEPKVAFLFLTRGDLHQEAVWNEYLNMANGSARVHAHTKDLETLAEESLLIDRQVSERFETSWGGISLVQATLSLLREALEDSEATHFVLVSESCVPVRPFDALCSSLRMDNRSRMRVRPWYEVRRRDVLKAQRLENIPGIRKEIAHFQDQWMCLNREDALLVVENDRTRAFQNVFAPDEAYFASVLAAVGKPPLQATANRPITWVDWSEAGAHPREFNQVAPRTAAEIAESGCFFARKFTPESDIGRFRLHGIFISGLTHKLQ